MMKTQLSNMDLIDFSSNYKSLIYQLKLTEELVSAKQSLAKNLKFKTSLVKLAIVFPGYCSKMSIKLNQLLLDVNIHSKTIAMMEKQRDFVLQEQLNPYAQECLEAFDDVLYSLTALSVSEDGDPSMSEILLSAKKNSKKWSNEICSRNPDVLVEKIECYYTMKNILSKKTSK